MKDDLVRIVERALASGSDDAEVFSKRAETRSWTYSPATGFLDGQRSDRGLALRLFRSGGLRFLAAPEGDALWDSPLDPPPAAGRKGPAARRAPSPHPSPPVGSRLEPGGEIPGDRRAFLRAVEREMIRLSSGNVRLLSLELEEGRHHSRLVSSRGIDVTSEGRGYHLVVRLTGEHDGKRLSAAVVEGGRELPSPVIVAGRAVDRILYPLKGRELPEKKGDLLVDPAVATAILAGLSDAFVAGRRPPGWPTAALLKDGRWGSPALTIVDDGRLEAGPNPQPFDGEGWPQRRRVVLREGAPGELLSDSAEAARLGLPPTGNAVRDSYRHPPAPGVTQCFIEPNMSLAPADLLAEIRSGYYLLSTAGRGEFDLVDDRFSIPVNGVFLQRGRARHAIRPALLAGKISELLRAVKAVAGDLAFFPREGWFGSPTLFLVGLRLS